MKQCILWLIGMTLKFLKNYVFSFWLVKYKAGIHKMFVRITNREDPDQTASSEAVWSGSALFA